MKNILRMVLLGTSLGCILAGGDGKAMLGAGCKEAPMEISPVRPLGDSPKRSGRAAGFPESPSKLQRHHDGASLSLATQRPRQGGESIAGLTRAGLRAHELAIRGVVPVGESSDDDGASEVSAAQTHRTSRTARTDCTTADNQLAKYEKLKRDAQKTTLEWKEKDKKRKEKIASLQKELETERQEATKDRLKLEQEISHLKYEMDMLRDIHDKCEEKIVEARKALNKTATLMFEGASAAVESHLQGLLSASKEAKAKLTPATVEAYVNAIRLALGQKLS